MSSSYFFSSQVNEKITPFFIVGLFTVFGALGNIITACSRPPLPESTTNENSGELDLSQEQLQQYARAVLLFEPYRQQAFEKIRDLIEEEPPNILCNEPSSFNSLPDEAQKIATDYCEISKKIVEDSGLSTVIFNRITLRLQTDEMLKQRVQNAMLEIQKQQPANNNPAPDN